MSLTHLVSSEGDASAVGHAMLLAQVLLDGPPEIGFRTFCYTTTPPTETSRATSPPPWGSNYNIAGVGVVHDEGRLHTAILEMASVPTTTIERLAKSRLHSVVQGLIRSGVNAMAEARVVRVSEPEFQAAPGNSVSASLNGTAGAQLNWGPGMDGILTAGHVAKSAGAPAKAGGTAGAVALSLDPTNHGKTPEADVSVIKLSAPVPPASRILGSTTAGPNDPVTVNTQGGPVSATIMGLMQWLWLPKANCTCGHVYMTTACVTKKGDSGAPVLKGGSLIGHVIGASVGMMSYIQVFDYQLQEIRNRPGFSAAKL